MVTAPVLPEMVRAVIVLVPLKTVKRGARLVLCAAKVQKEFVMKMFDCAVPRHLITKLGVPDRLVVSKMNVRLTALVVEVMSVGRLSVVPSQEKQRVLLAVMESTLPEDACTELALEPLAKLSAAALPVVPKVRLPWHVSEEFKVEPPVLMVKSGWLAALRMRQVLSWLLK